MKRKEKRCTDEEPPTLVVIHLMHLLNFICYSISFDKNKSASFSTIIWSKASANGGKSSKELKPKYVKKSVLVPNIIGRPIVSFRPMFSISERASNVWTA